MGCGWIDVSNLWCFLDVVRKMMQWPHCGFCLPNDTFCHAKRSSCARARACAQCFWQLSVICFRTALDLSKSKWNRFQRLQNMLRNIVKFLTRRKEFTGIQATRTSLFIKHQTLETNENHNGFVSIYLNHKRTRCFFTEKRKEKKNRHLNFVPNSNWLKIQYKPR